MAGLFETGRIVDLIVAFVAIEAVLLVVLRRRGLARPIDIVAALLPGVALLLAVRAALTGLAWPVTAAFLTLSLFAHGFDLHRRARASEP